MIKVYFLEPTDREQRWLRRYGQGPCTASRGYCNGMFELGEFDIRYRDDGLIEGDRASNRPPKTDPRWPAKCDHCRTPFGVKGSYQLFSRQIYIRTDTGLRYTLEDAPPGACWDAWWIKRERRGAGPTGCGYMLGDDHRSLVVKCPDGHQWMIDGRASNCTMKDDNAHHCWVRHGKPEDGTLHVDKAGHTCAAGAGSIQTPSWHGFLLHGELIG